MPFQAFDQVIHRRMLEAFHIFAQSFADIMTDQCSIIGNAQFRRDPLQIVNYVIRTCTTDEGRSERRRFLRLLIFIIEALFAPCCVPFYGDFELYPMLLTIQASFIFIPNKGNIIVRIANIHVDSYNVVYLKLSTISALP